jgi:hypothetical protein
MMILDRGGIPAEHNPEINKKINPFGSFETGNFENIPEDKCIKCLTPMQLFDLPVGEYKVIMPVRNPEQIYLSRVEAFQKPNLAMNKANPNVEMQKKMIEKHYRFLRFIVENRPDMELLEVPYDDYFLKTEDTIDKIAEFVGVPFDQEEATKAIDHTYYKIRE